MLATKEHTCANQRRPDAIFILGVRLSNVQVLKVFRPLCVYIKLCLVDEEKHII